jgi:predicted MFS family arabinose efflux permease
VKANASSGTDATTAGPGKFPLLAVLVLAFAGFVSVNTELMPSGLLTDIAPALDASVSVTGTMTSVYALGIVLTVLPLTRVTLTMSRRRVLVGTVLLFVVSNVVVALAPNLAVALIGRFLGGASHGLLWAVLPPVIGRIASPAHAGRAMAIIFTGNSLGLAAGAPLSALLGGAVGWRMAFVVIAAAGLATAALLFRVVPLIQMQQQGHMPLLQAARLPGALRVSVGWALMLLGHFAVFTYIAPYLENAGLGGAAVSGSLFVLGVAGILGVTLAGRVPRRALLAGLLVSPALIVAAFGVLAVAPLSTPLVVAVLVVWGAGFAAAVLFNQQAVLVAGQRAPETVTSISVLVMQFGIALGATVGGVAVSTWGVAATPVAGLVFVAASAALLAGMRSALRVPA